MKHKASVALTRFVDSWLEQVRSPRAGESSAVQTGRRVGAAEMGGAVEPKLYIPQTGMGTTKYITFDQEYLVSIHTPANGGRKQFMVSHEARQLHQMYSFQYQVANVMRITKDAFARILRMHPGASSFTLTSLEINRSRHGRLPEELDAMQLYPVFHSPLATDIVSEKFIRDGVKLASEIPQANRATAGTAGAAGAAGSRTTLGFASRPLFHTRTSGGKVLLIGGVLTMVITSHKGGPYRVMLLNKARRLYKLYKTIGQAANHLGVTPRFLDGRRRKGRSFDLIIPAINYYIRKSRRNPKVKADIGNFPTTPCEADPEAMEAHFALHGTVPSS